MRSFAIVPAAGQGRRLGGDKLLLACRGSTILGCHLRAWTSSNVSTVVVVLRRSDQRAQAIAAAAGVEIVCPEKDPCDMKMSVQIGLRHIELEHSPLEDDVWMLAPADMPRLAASDVNGVLTAHDPQQPTIIVPEFEQQAGHPVLFPWTVRQQVFQLGDEEGIDRLVRQSPSRRVVVSNQGCVEDIDTQQEYQQLLSGEPDRTPGP